jgi:hypothetical protein
MLKLLKVLGFDFSRQIALVKVRAEELKFEIIDEIKGQAINIGVMIGLLVAGAIMALATSFIGLIALYRWMAISYGPFVALGVVAATTTFLAVVFVCMGLFRRAQTTPFRFRRSSTGSTESPRDAIAQTIVTPLAEEKASYSTSPTNQASTSSFFSTSDLQQPVAKMFSAFAMNPPLTDSTLDGPIKELGANSATDARRIVQSGAEIVRTGPRSAAFGVLAASVLIGWFLARNRHV